MSATFDRDRRKAGKTAVKANTKAKCPLQKSETAAAEHIRKVGTWKACLETVT